MTTEIYEPTKIWAQAYKLFGFVCYASFHLFNGATENLGTIRVGDWQERRRPVGSLLTLFPFTHNRPGSVGRQNLNLPICAMEAGYMA